MYRASLAILVAAILFLGPVVLSAQQETENLLIQELTINSKALGEERDLTISLPVDYHNSENTYPVLYLLDGRTHFQHANGAVSFLSANGSIPNMIVVSIHNVDRNRDFSPAHVERIPSSGGADKFLEFLDKELTALLNKTYRMSDFSVLMGHSFGGTFAAHAVSAMPGLFDAYIMVSPFLQFKENYVIGEAGKLIRPYKKGKSIYLTVGDEPDYFTPIEEFSAIVKKSAEGTIDYKVEKMLSENHGTIPYISLYNGLKFTFSDWPILPEALEKGLEAVDEHIARNSARYGVNVRTSEIMINQLGYARLQNNEVEKAIEIFTENVKRYPASANVYDSLGEAYERNDQLKLAEENYQKACDLGKALGDRNYAIYFQNLLRVRKALES